jgi:Na+-translocating ferredoxin:NAD+ oxidoreductase subunit D
MKFPITPSPHVLPVTSVPVIMRQVLYALVPATATYVWYFGFGLCVNMLIACMSALISEAIMLRARNRPIKPSLIDGSAIVTAVLIAFAIPPVAPWWLPALGAASAIILAKHLYGGIGANLFNPAMVGYAILLLSFPVEMTHWIPPQVEELGFQKVGLWNTIIYSVTGMLPLNLNLDAVTQATPLDIIKGGLKNGLSINELKAGPLFGQLGSYGWEWVSSFTAFGGIYLLYKGIIRWHIPISLLTSITIVAAIFYLFEPNQNLSPSFHLLSGATVIGAFFIATDPVSAAATNQGRLIYGASIGVLTYAIRTWGGYPDGLAFAVLLMNSMVPLIDRFTRPKIYGQP